MATMILIAAAIIAFASAAVAISRSSGGKSAEAGPHGSSKPEEPVGSVVEKIAQLESRLKQEPNNAAGWRMLGWSYFETGDLLRSAGAYRRAAAVEPNNAENWSSLGEALQTASQSVDQEAAQAFERALTLDRADPRARYFLAVQKDLGGQHEAAIADWIALLRDTPPGAPWEADLRRTIQQVAQKQKIEVASRMPPPSQGSAATAAIPGPTGEQLAAASSIAPSQQSEMVRGMVDRLASRLKASPARRRRLDAADARADGSWRDGCRRPGHRSALAAFKGDSAAQAKLNRAAEELGVPSGG
jgi:cytochrome c-type biogenesis protein CcmH